METSHFTSSSLSQARNGQSPKPPIPGPCHSPLDQSLWGLNQEPDLYQNTQRGDRWRHYFLGTPPLAKPFVLQCSTPEPHEDALPARGIRLVAGEVSAILHQPL